MLFNIYILLQGHIIYDNNIAYHSYADDAQIYLALSSKDSSPLDSLCRCLEHVNSWMQSSSLQLNQDKKEIILFGNKMERIKIATQLDSTGLDTKTQVRHFGVLIDSDLSFSSHIKAVTKITFHHLKQI